MKNSFLLITTLASVTAGAPAIAGPCADRLSALSTQIAMDPTPAAPVNPNATATTSSRANEWRLDTTVHPVSSGLPSGGTATQRERAFERLALSPEPSAQHWEALRPGRGVTATQWERANEGSASGVSAREAALAQLDQAQALDAENNPGCAQAIEQYEQIRRVR